MGIFRPSDGIFEDLDTQGHHGLRSEPSLPSPLTIPLGQQQGFGSMLHMPPVDGGSKRGRITLYCIAENFDRKRLEELLVTIYGQGSILSYPDCFYVDYLKSSEDDPGGGERPLKDQPVQLDNLEQSISLFDNLKSMTTHPSQTYSSLIMALWHAGG